LKKLSAKITFLGIAWILMGILNILSEISSYSDSVLLNKLASIFQVNYGIFVLDFLAAFMSVNSLYTLLLNCSLFSIFIFCGIGILKLKPLARNIAEFLTWLILLFFILKFTFPIYEIFYFENKQDGPGWMLIGMLIFYCLILLIGTVWSSVLLWLVKSSDVKEKFKNSNKSE